MDDSGEAELSIVRTMLRAISSFLHRLMTINSLMIIVKIRILLGMVTRLRMLMRVKMWFWMRRPVSVILEMMSK